MKKLLVLMLTLATGLALLGCETPVGIPMVHIDGDNSGDITVDSNSPSVDGDNSGDLSEDNSDNSDNSVVNEGGE